MNPNLFKKTKIYHETAARGLRASLRIIQ